jgi:hypothetical protein
LVNEQTPEERLKKYKERLAKMAQEEGRNKVVNTLKEKDTVVKKIPPSPKPAHIEPPIGPRPKPPAVLESPAKRELRESQVVKKRRDELLRKLEGKGGKSRVMLRARQKAITSQLDEIKSRKSVLELQLKRKVIGRDEFEKRRNLLIKEGQELIKEKAEIDEALAK